MGAATTVVSLDYIQRTRDVDAAIYLLDVLLGTSSPTVNENREKMKEILDRIKRTKKVAKHDRQQIAHLYRELRT